MATITGRRIFHVVAPDFQAVVRLSDLRIVAGDARRGQIAEVLAWARINRESLLRKWTELNERG